MRKFWPQCTYFVHDKGIGKSMGDNRITEIHIYFGKIDTVKGRNQIYIQCTCMPQMLIQVLSYTMTGTNNSGRATFMTHPWTS